MRNLQQTIHNHHAVEHVASTCYVLGDLFVVLLKDGVASVQNTKSGRKIVEFDVPSVTPDIADTVADCHYDENDDRLCIVMVGGNIITLNFDDDERISAQVEIVGTIDEEVLAARWSPDHQILAIVTRHQLNLLTQQFDSLAEVPIRDEDVKASANQVSVGWGRTETQFRGKRLQRDPTLPESIETGTLTTEDRASAVLSWRGDGEYLCLSSISNHRRVIRVYAREGVLESTSEPVDGLSDVLSWRPDGSVIAAVQRSVSESNHCIFFEKNGLRHGEFQLRTHTLVLDLQWNCVSTVLAVLYEDCLDLWVPSNYHYALKRRIPLLKAQTIHWDREDPLKMLIKGHETLSDVQFQWTISSHEIQTPFDFGVVAVIDGYSIGLTPMRIANVPPPMAFQNIVLHGIPRDIAISSDTKLLCVLLDSEVVFYQWRLDDKRKRPPSLLVSLPLRKRLDAWPLQIVHNSAGRTFVLFSSSEIVEVNPAQPEQENSLQLSSVCTIIPCGDGIVAQKRSGEADAILGAPDDLQHHDLAFPSQKCETYRCIKTESTLLITLSHTNKLYVSEHCIATKVTSFLLIRSVLVYTTASHLRFINLEAKDTYTRNDSEADNDHCRAIERGSIIICSSPTAQSIVLQAPRGNLETVYPRLLVLSSIRELLDAKKWIEAWKLVKLHRIDTNIVYDYNVSQFLDDLDSFIIALATSTELDIFLSGLKDENVICTMYPTTSITLGTPPIRNDADVPNKVNSICDAILSKLNTAYSKSHLSSILTAHLTRKPSDYRAALFMLAALPDEEKEHALTHICFLADPHLLYTQALGLYDLKNALLLAQRSQKDPREYVPFLQKIQNLDLHRQHFVLDDYLGLPIKAMGSLVKIESAWDECKAYISRHLIWSDALDLLKYDEKRYSEVLAMYAVHLLSIQDYSAAGYAFESVLDYNQAALAFERASLWREALHNAKLAKLPVVEVAERLRDQMADRSKFLEAAEISQTQLEDQRGAIKFFCRAYEFNQAIQLAGTQGRIVELVHPGLVEAFAHTSETFAEMKVQLQNQIPRLKNVRARKDENPENYFDGNAEDDTPDNVSLAGTQASTSASFFTRYTGATAMTTQSKRSGKARRRQERQRAKGKQGTIWEEEYLISSIRRLVIHLGESFADTQRLVITLFRCGFKQNASELQNSILSLIELAKSNLDEVFAEILTLPVELQRSVGSKPELPHYEKFRLC